MPACHIMLKVQLGVEILVPENEIIQILLSDSTINRSIINKLEHIVEQIIKVIKI